MTATIDISVHAVDEMAPVVFRELVQRLLLPGSVRAWLRMAGQTEPRDPVTMFDLQSLTEVRDSDQVLWVRGQVQTHGRAELYANIFFYGNDVSGGSPLRPHGRISIELEHSAVAKLRPYRYRTTLAQATVPKLRLHVLEHVFLTVCGLDPLTAHPTVPIDHAVLCEEGRWRSPDECSYVYHRDVTAFGRDIARIYAYYHFGFLPAMSLMPPFPLQGISPGEWRIEATSPLPVPSAGLAPSLQWEHPEMQPEQHQLFVAELTPTIVQRTASLAPDAIRAAFALARRETEIIRWIDLSDSGLMLFVHPLLKPRPIDPERYLPQLLTLWPAYSAIVEAASTPT